MGAFAPELLAEALPELSEISASSPRLFQAITTRLQQSRLGQLGARLGRWILPREGEEFNISRARLARVLSNTERSSTGQLSLAEALGEEGPLEFFRDVGDIGGDIGEANERAFREVEIELQELRDGVEGERFYDNFPPQLGIPGDLEREGLALTEDFNIVRAEDRAALRSTRQRIRDGIDGLRNYFDFRIPIQRAMP